jgi:hypothetical protein
MAANLSVPASGDTSANSVYRAGVSAVLAGSFAGLAACDRLWDSLPRLRIGMMMPWCSTPKVMNWTGKFRFEFTVTLD